MAKEPKAAAATPDTGAPGKPAAAAKRKKEFKKKRERRIMSMIMAADEPDAAALYRLMAWLSPSYPVGAFSYSSGIEWAVESGDITNADTLKRWLAAIPHATDGKNVSLGGQRCTCCGF